MKPIIEVQKSVGEPYDCLIYKGKQKRYVGFAKVVVEGDREAVVYYIYIKPSQRRKGYGNALLEDLKNSFNLIKTQVSASSPESITFFKNKGFIVEGDWLKWRKNRAISLTPSAQKSTAPMIISPS